jgi:muramoyltetrapeptide carboxypeptidase
VDSAPPPVLVARALKKGDPVALVSPAGPTRDRPAVEAGIAKLKSWGLEPILFRNAFASHGFLAGNDDRRLEDLQSAISDPKWRAIWCVRGGYGVTRLLDRLDLRPLARDPKPIIGYSDITALHVAVRETVGLVGFHGPMMGHLGPDSLSAENESLLRKLLFGEPVGLYTPNPQDPPPHVMREGVAEGPLVGGNLALLSALAGTTWAPKFAGSLVFIEDVEEPPYRIDRMLTQLLQATDLRKAAGIVLGDFAKSGAPEGTDTTDLMWVLKDRLGDLGIPVAYGFPFGHRRHVWTLPHGLPAKLDASDLRKTPTLRLLYLAVSGPRARGR